GDDRLTHERLTWFRTRIRVAAVLLWPPYGEVACVVEAALPGPQLDDALGITELGGRRPRVCVGEVGLPPMCALFPGRLLPVADRRVHRRAPAFETKHEISNAGMKSNLRTMVEKSHLGASPRRQKTR